MTLGLKDLYYAVCTEADGAESYGCLLYTSPSPRDS